MVKAFAPPAPVANLGTNSGNGNSGSPAGRPFSNAGEPHALSFA